MTDAEGQSADYAYDNVGNMVKMVTGQTEKIADLFRALPEGVTYTTYEYDRFGNVTKATDSLGKSVTSEYNLMGLPVKQTDRNGISTYNEYNAYGSVLMSSTTCASSSFRSRQIRLTRSAMLSASDPFSNAAANWDIRKLPPVPCSQ